MTKKKNKQVIRPWCWYCEREFEDEKVLMQHQKAKHFKCNMCPRRLNTAGGLAVHIQQVHKLEPENLPRIENALPGRDGYEVEIFGMEGIPAPDVADYKRRKEIELGLAAGSISQPQTKRPRVENRPLSEDELKAQLEAHKALMGAAEGPSIPPAPDPATSAVYGAPPQAYTAPSASPPGFPAVASPATSGFLPPPPAFAPPIPPAGPFPGQPPFARGMPSFPSGPTGVSVPPGIPLPSGVMPPFPAAVSSLGSMPPPAQGASLLNAPPASEGAAVGPGATSLPQDPGPGSPSPMSRGEEYSFPPPLKLPDPTRVQTNPPFKKKTILKYTDANFSPGEHRARDIKYYFPISSKKGVGMVVEESRAKKRARAEDYL